MPALKAALAYAEQGWPVFPCHPETKQPLLAADKDPVTGSPVRGTGGLKKASIDSALIRQWWSRWPKAMIGLPTGSSIGAFVIDIDAGVDSTTGEVFSAENLQATLEREIHQALPRTWIASTPRGGLHIYFSSPPGDPFPGNRSGLLPRIDVRGEGGYVVVPPSVRADQKNYTWVVPPEETQVAEAPPALLELLRRRLDGGRKRVPHPIAGTGELLVSARSRYGQAALEGELKNLAEAVPGTRNDSLFHASIRLGQLVAAGALEIASVRGCLANAARGWNNFDKSLGTIESGLSKGLKEPRSLSSNRQGSPPSRPNNSPPAPPSNLDIELVDYELSDYGNARRFARRNEGRLVFCEQTRWFWWTGAHWSQESSEIAVKRAVHSVIEGLMREAAAHQPSSQSRDRQDD